jgi:hypothetical protein
MFDTAAYRGNPCSMCRPAGVSHLIIDSMVQRAVSVRSKGAARRRHCHGAFLAERRRVAVCGGGARLTHGPALLLWGLRVSVLAVRWIAKCCLLLPDDRSESL